MAANTPSVIAPVGIVRGQSMSNRGLLPFTWALQRPSGGRWADAVTRPRNSRSGGATATGHVAVTVLVTGACHKNRDSARDSAVTALVTRAVTALRALRPRPRRCPAAPAR